MDSAVDAPIERRRRARRASVGAHGIVGARIRPGHRAAIVDICDGGALVETDHRLLPGRSVELQMENGSDRITMRGRVLRCAVATLRAESICYRGAIAFDRDLPWFVNDGNGGVAATPTVI